MALLKFHIPKTNTRTTENRRVALELGKTGERLAEKYLTDKGYIVIERNYHQGHLEIDLIALDKDELVIVEVKTRAHDNVLQPEEAVDHKKRLSLIRLANEYVRSHGRQENVRFDVVSIVSNGDHTEINHIENAFNIFSF